MDRRLFYSGGGEKSNAVMVLLHKNGVVSDLRALKDKGTEPLAVEPV